MPENQTVSAITYDAVADVLRVDFAGAVAGASSLTVAFDDGARLVHYDPSGRPVAMEFPHASQGLDLAGVPHEEAIREAAEKLGLGLAPR